MYLFDANTGQYKFYQLEEELPGRQFSARKLRTEDIDPNLFGMDIEYWRLVGVKQIVSLSDDLIILDKGDIKGKAVKCMNWILSVQPDVLVEAY